jgi:hypothetical protein
MVMRLLNVNAQKLELVEFFGDQIPPYAILSHTWGDDEVTFQDLQRGQYEHKLGLEKIRYTCQQAKRDELSWCWVDTCCIDKTSSAELSEAINSMFNWYSRAQVCYAYLADVRVNSSCEPCVETQADIERVTNDFSDASAKSSGGTPAQKEPRWTSCTELHHQTTTIGTPSEHCNRRTPGPVTSLVVAFRDSRWFQRGWTLQELIAPRRLNFFDHSWEPLGRRDDELLDAVTEVTGLNPMVFGNPLVLREVPIARRMSWMARRQTTRKEDEAYCLLGVFGVNMPLLYGEEDSAFVRLQEELLRRFPDNSVLIFTKPTTDNHMTREPLASSPRDFAGCSHVESWKTQKIPFALEACRLTNVAIHISLPLLRIERTNYLRDLALLGYTNNGAPIAIVLIRTRGHSGKDIWFTSNYAIHHFFSQDVVPIPTLGSGFVAIPEELAVTAKRESMLIGRDVRYALSGYDQRGDDAWLRYDLALKYESGTPGLIPERTITRQREARTPHMIRIKDLFPISSKVFVLAFSLDDIGDLAHTTVVVALTNQRPGGNLRGALLVAKNLHLESEQQLSALGTDLMHAKLSEPYAGNLGEVRDLDNVFLGEGLVLDLQRDGYVGDWSLRLSRLTLRIRTLDTNKRQFSDGSDG